MGGDKAKSRHNSARPAQIGSVPSFPTLGPKSRKRRVKREELFI